MAAQAESSRFSLDIDRSFTKPFATASCSNSVQSKKSLAEIVSSLTSNLAARKPHTESKLKLSAQQSPTVAPENLQPTPAHQQNSIPLPKMNPTKSRSIISRIASKFQQSQKTPQTSTPASQLDANAAQERRQAALRARGLAPQKDLSQLEKEMDLLNDSLDQQTANANGEAPIQSAADAIKRDWELKNSLSILTPVDISLVDPCQVPLPPSPTLSISELPDSHMVVDPCSIPLPPSPIPERGRVAETTNFRQWKFPTEPASNSAPVIPPQEVDLLPVPASPTETDSVMGASIATPSLAADSVTRTISSTTDTTTSTSASALSNELRVQTSIPPGVPIIVESPIEEAELVDIPETGVYVPEEKNGDPSLSTCPTTDPAKPKKKPHKLSIRNIQRSVVGSLSSKPRSPRFNALPPSPKLPPPLRSATVGVTRSPSVRTPRSPTMYNRGSILLQTNDIEDEESRRLGEMAFLT